MASQVVSSLAALGIALAPALLKFAEVPRGAALEESESAQVACIAAHAAPVHARYQATGTSERLNEGSVVQVLSKRKNWRHIAYVVDDTAELGWITEQYLEPCEGPEHGEPGPEAETESTTPAAPTDEGEIDASPHLLLGTPTDEDPSDDHLVDHGIFVLSYNGKRNTPNWVAWKLSAEDLGDEDRKNDFRPDDALPAEFVHVSNADYLNTGFDRGHMCPSAHRTSTEQSNSLTFLLSNMQPQTHALNAGPWKSLETFERKLADEQGKDVYVVAGGIFGARPKLIGRGVAIPKSNFRVTVVLEHGRSVRDIDGKTPVYAVKMPNDTSPRGHKWEEYRQSVDALEEDTGYDFLSALPDALESSLEQAVPTPR